MAKVHPLKPFIETNEAAEKLADRVRCSVAHLINISAGRRTASLKLAKRLSEKTGLPMETFMRPEDAMEAAE